MTEEQRQELIIHYEELAETCDSIGFAQAARVWRYRADRLRNINLFLTGELQ